MASGLGCLALILLFPTEGSAVFEQLFSILMQNRDSTRQHPWEDQITEYVRYLEICKIKGIIVFAFKDFSVKKRRRSLAQRTQGKPVDVKNSYNKYLKLFLDLPRVFTGCQLGARHRARMAGANTLLCSVLTLEFEGAPILVIS